MSEAVILCEGFYDRDFWGGWLEYLGCARPVPGKVVDSQGIAVRGERHAGYWTRSKRFVRIVPCRGKENVLPEARRRIRARRLDPVPWHLVVCVDPDTEAGSGSAATGLRPADLLHQVRQVEPSAATNADGDIELNGGKTKVSLLRWEVAADDAPGMPRQQTLEWLACSALIVAYPGRGPAIVTWLASRPEAAPAGPKEHAWSHMAGWYAEFGCAAFYKNLWADPKIACELETRLRACGAWRIADQLVS
jgi:hypothetical protein